VDVTRDAGCMSILTHLECTGTWVCR